MLPSQCLPWIYQLRERPRRLLELHHVKNLRMSPSVEDLGLDKSGMRLERNEQRGYLHWDVVAVRER